VIAGFCFCASCLRFAPRFSDVFSRFCNSRRVRTQYCDRNRNRLHRFHKLPL